MSGQYVDEKTRKAVERVEDITGFYVHVTIYVIINLLLVLINFTITDDVIWAHWVVLGWGLGLLAHAVAVYGRVPGFITRWQMRKMRQLRKDM